MEYVRAFRCPKCQKKGQYEGFNLSILMPVWHTMIQTFPSVVDPDASAMPQSEAIVEPETTVKTLPEKPSGVNLSLMIRCNDCDNRDNAAAFRCDYLRETGETDPITLYHGVNDQHEFWESEDRTVLLLRNHHEKCWSRHEDLNFRDSSKSLAELVVRGNYRLVHTKRWTPCGAGFRLTQVFG